MRIRRPSSTRFPHLAIIPLIATFSLSASADVTDTIERTIDFDSDGRISLSNINGDVAISACDCSQVKITAVISASSQELRDRITVDISESSDRIRIRTRYEENEDGRKSWNHGRSEVEYTLSVPNDVNLNGIELVNGDLEIEGVTGKLDAEMVNGELSTDAMTSSTKIDMVNGDMDVRFTTLSKAEYIDLESVNGAINLYLPADANATVSAETVSGRISNDFGIQVIKHKYVGSEMRGTIGNGDVRIDLENVNGRIKVKRL